MLYIVLGATEAISKIYVRVPFYQQDLGLIHLCITHMAGTVLVITSHSDKHDSPLNAWDLLETRLI